MKTIALAALLVLAITPRLHAHDVKGERFLYDGATWLQQGAMLPGKNRYEAGVARAGERTFAALLEFTPGEGDRILVGELRGDDLHDPQVVDDGFGQYRNPTLTADGRGGLWLSCEVLAGDRWEILARHGVIDGPFEESHHLGAAGVSNINHAAAAITDGGLALAWQSDRGGQWDIVFQAIDAKGHPGESAVLSSNPLGDWHPAIAANGRGEITLAWDAYDGESFSVRARTFDGAEWKKPVTVTNSPAFEGRASLAYDRTGRCFIAWEEGELNWGKEYRGSLSIPGTISDSSGPVHRFRLLRVAELEGDGNKVADLAFPLPTVAAAAKRERGLPGRERLGVFYERPRLLADDSDRLWIVYRHYYYPELALPAKPKSHVEAGWRLYARCLVDGKWSELIALEPNQRDGLQRLSLAPQENGLLALWGTGRTHRGKAIGPHGVALARLEAGPDLKFLEPSEIESTPPVSTASSSGSGKRSAEFAAESVDGVDYNLFMGDLHRHTDLSLCRVYYDGTLDDAYRYAIEAGELDFLGVTDHCRDIANGNARSRLWWRSIKEVTRHRLEDTFFPLFAFERSHGETDHNVISLRDDMLRPYQPPLAEFWKEIDKDTFTIPHNPIRALRAFAFHDDEKRPLLEIYQGCRDNPMHKEAHAGLARGHHMGFIGSSDHMATSSSYACVWSPAKGAEPIFRSMQARRTYGATARIRLVFRAGTHWMGEIVPVEAMPMFQFEADGSAPVARVDVYRDGKIVETFKNPSPNTHITGKFRGQGDLASNQYFYIHLVQEDGNQAWSSPIWLEHKTK